MHRYGLTLVLVGMAALVGIPDSVAPDSTTAFKRITGHYEIIRQALLHDGIDGIGAAAREIQSESDALESTLRGISEKSGNENAARVRDLLPGIRSATHALETAEDLQQAREAFGTLSELLVRYHGLVDDPESVVAFCSMAQKAWLQPGGEIGNPYYGQSMARCGEIVSR